MSGVMAVEIGPAPVEDGSAVTHSATTLQTKSWRQTRVAVVGVIEKDLSQVIAVSCAMFVGLAGRPGLVAITARQWTALERDVNRP